MHMKRTRPIACSATIIAGRCWAPVRAQNGRLRRLRPPSAAMCGVGLEDSLWIGAGQLAASNADQGDAGSKDHRRAGTGGRDGRRGTRNPSTQGRRQGRLLKPYRSE